jgi:hypothetical protein
LSKSSCNLNKNSFFGRGVTLCLSSGSDESSGCDGRGGHDDEGGGSRSSDASHASGLSSHPVHALLHGAVSALVAAEFLDVLLDSGELIAGFLGVSGSVHAISVVGLDISPLNKLIESHFSLLDGVSGHITSRSDLFNEVLALTSGGATSGLLLHRSLVEAKRGEVVAHHAAHDTLLHFHNICLGLTLHHGHSILFAITGGDGRATLRGTFL